MIGHSAIDFIHPDDLESTRSEMRAARRGLQKRNFETRYVHKDGQAVTLNWFRHLVGAGATAFLHRPRPDSKSTLRKPSCDISRKWMRSASSPGGVAHDFNNILTVITGTIGILEEAVAERPELVAITKLIDEAADRGAI